ncbi:N6-L-threonylcarbamoyladenine synthase [Caloranaerobacter azorensis DSM 13643]|uniref:N(6)-L-threonylcarbamoyladenine synthase n=2 Tax=Caloranaerobacter azorensis TaxID=116090 RepID=A0A1M5RZ77_9FIRM|nr:N6-L-threonylcarbamoyladenine synthase [Caloranaerobacter azorensis DSM 13643]
MILMDSYYLGIDTSAYTTSIAVLNEEGKIIIDLRRTLKVKKGSLGLRQQEAVFQHINNLPEMFNYIANEIDLNKVKTVSASVKPRNVVGSYMPVFKVAQGHAFILARALNADYKEFSHQDGHIAAGILNCEIQQLEKFLALHISGGTTELLLVENKKDVFSVEQIGGTLDISAGQLIDRVGVELGLPFPCGPYLDELSVSGNFVEKNIPISTNKTWINFSGPETFFKRIIKQHTDKPENIALTLFDCIAKSLSSIIKYAIKVYEINNILIIGGVASNSYIREKLENDIVNKGIGKLFFPNKNFCTDNAIGIAYLGLIKY